jgi:hypothetical protein
VKKLLFFREICALPSASEEPSGGKISRILKVPQPLAPHGALSQSLLTSS